MSVLLLCGMFFELSGDNVVVSFVDFCRGEGSWSCCVGLLRLGEASYCRASVCGVGGCEG